jgi:hypothetical protein
MTEGVMDCAVVTLAANRVRKVKRRGREGKNLRLVIFMLNYSFTIAIIQNY